MEGNTQKNTTQLKGIKYELCENSWNMNSAIVHLFGFCDLITLREGGSQQG